jgi:hypothetical protein
MAVTMRFPCLRVPSRIFVLSQRMNGVMVGGLQLARCGYSPPSIVYTS